MSNRTHPPSPTRPTELPEKAAGIEAWLRHALRQQYDEVARESLPEGLLQLLPPE